MICLCCVLVPVHSPWFHVGIDFVGLDQDQGINIIILTLVIISQSAWVEAIVLHNKEAQEVASTLLKVR